MSPGQLESDKDRLLLIQDKEQLLRELRSITPRSRSPQEMDEVRDKIQRLQQDLNNAMEVSNRCIADRYVVSLTFTPLHLRKKKMKRGKLSKSVEIPAALNSPSQIFGFPMHFLEVSHHVFIGSYPGTLNPHTTS